MEWQKVESKQIAEIAFEDNSDPDETILGVRFKTKSEREGVDNKEGEKRSEYHYKNVTPREFRAMLTAKSVDAYFKTAIKDNPEGHPYEKIADRPTSPNGTTKTVGTSSETLPLFPIKEASSDTTDSGNYSAPATEKGDPSPGSALAKIDSLTPDFVFVPGNMDKILIAIREQALAMVKPLNISTPKMRKSIKDVKNLVVKSRTYIEKMRVGYVSA